MMCVSVFVSVYVMSGKFRHPVFLVRTSDVCPTERQRASAAVRCVTVRIRRFLALRTTSRLNYYSYRGTVSEADDRNRDPNIDQDLDLIA